MASREGARTVTPEIKALLGDLANLTSYPLGYEYDDIRQRAAAILAADAVPPTDKTVRVRIAVAFTGDGDWYAGAHSADRDDEAMIGALDFFDGWGIPAAWITADVPVPETPEIAGAVEAA